MLGMDIRSRTLQVEACSAFPLQTDSRHITKSTTRVKGTRHGQLIPCPGGRHISELVSICPCRSQLFVPVRLFVSAMLQFTLDVSVGESISKV